MKLLDLLSIPGCLQLSKMLKAVESALKFSLRVLWKMVLFVRDFQTWWRVQSIVKCKYLFPSILP